MVSTCMHPRYALDSAKCMPLLKITGSVIELWNFRSQFLYNSLLVSHLAAIYGKNSYWLLIVGIQFLLLKKDLPDFLDQELQYAATRNAAITKPQTNKHHKTKPNKTNNTNTNNKTQPKQTQTKKPKNHPENSDSLNHLGWKRPLRSSSPTINSELPRLL